MDPSALYQPTIKPLPQYPIGLFAVVTIFPFNARLPVRD